MCPEAQEFKKHFEEAMAHNEKVLAQEEAGEDEVCTPKPLVHVNQSIQLFQSEYPACHSSSQYGSKAMQQTSDCKLVPLQLSALTIELWALNKGSQAGRQDMRVC